MIRKLVLHYVRLPMKEVFTTSFGTETIRHTLIVKVEGEGGEVGWGEVVADGGPWYSYETVWTAWHVIRDYVSLMIKGRDVQPEGFPQIVKRIRGHNMAKAGVEFALWDLKGRVEGRSLKELIGGVKDRVEVGLSVGIMSDVRRLIKRVEEGLNQGFRRIKLKIRPGWDVDIVKAVRREFGNIPLQVDANAAYTLSDVKVFKELDRYDLLMIEQPLHYDDLIEHAELQKAIKTPICLDESIKSLRDARAAHKLGSCRIINVKPGRVGGLVEVKAIHDFTQSVNMPIWIGGMLETGIGRAFAVAAASLPNVRYPSDISPSSRFWVEDLVEPPWELSRDGFMKVPSKPGIGVEVIEERLSKYLVKKLELTL